MDIIALSELKGVLIMTKKSENNITASEQNSSFVTDTLTGVLKNDYDDKAVMSERYDIKTH